MKNCLYRIVITTRLNATQKRATQRNPNLAYTTTIPEWCINTHRCNSAAPHHCPPISLPSSSSTHCIRSSCFTPHSLTNIPSLLPTQTSLIFFSETTWTFVVSAVTVIGEFSTNWDYTVIHIINLSAPLLSHHLSSFLQIDHFGFPVFSPLSPMQDMADIFDDILPSSEAYQLHREFDQPCIPTIPITHGRSISLMPSLGPDTNVTLPAFSTSTPLEPFAPSPRGVQYSTSPCSSHRFSESECNIYYPPPSPAPIQPFANYPKQSFSAQRLVPPPSYDKTHVFPDTPIHDNGSTTQDQSQLQSYVPLQSPNCYGVAQPHWSHLPQTPDLEVLNLSLAGNELVQNQPVQPTQNIELKQPQPQPPQNASLDMSNAPPTCILRPHASSARSCPSTHSNSDSTSSCAKRRYGGDDPVNARVAQPTSGKRHRSDGTATALSTERVSAEGPSASEEEVSRREAGHILKTESHLVGVMQPSAKAILERRAKAMREGRRKDAKLTEAERRIVRRLRNRESAERCRIRRVQHAALREQQMMSMQRENERLLAEAQYFRNAISQYQSIIEKFSKKTLPQNGQGSTSVVGPANNVRGSTHCN